MSKKEALKEAEQQAETLMHAAAIFEELLEAQTDMEENDMLPDDEAAEDMRKDMETARDACQAVSLSMTIAMAQEGYIPDFDAAERSDTDSDDDVSPTFH